MKRPEPRFRIYESTRLFALEHDPHVGLAWRSFDIVKKTANSVFIATHLGELRLDRIALEKNGECVRAGTTYRLHRFDLPRQERIAS